MNHSELVWLTNLDCWWQSPDHITHTCACRFHQFPSRQHIEQFTFQQNWFMFNFVCFRPSNHVYGENYVVARKNNQGATLQPQTHHQGYSWPPHHHLGLWQYVAIWLVDLWQRQTIIARQGRLPILWYASTKLGFQCWIWILSCDQLWTSRIQISYPGMCRRFMEILKFHSSWPPNLDAILKKVKENINLKWKMEASWALAA